MGVEALGAYLRQLREFRELTAMDVVVAILQEDPDFRPRPTPAYISKLEHGQIGSPGLLLVSAINRALGGSTAHVSQLVLDRKATTAQARKLAVQWLALGDAEREQLAVLNSAPITSLRRLLRRLAGLLEDEAAPLPGELPPELQRYVQTPEGRQALLKALEEVRKRGDR